MRPGVDLDRLEAELEARSRVSTHWSDCLYDLRHRDCAIAALIQELREARATIASLDQERGADGR